MVVSSARLMKKASREGYAIPAFNIDNLESAMAVSEVMHEMRLPVIVQMIPRTLNYGGIAMYPAMMRELMADCPVDYALHLDHGNSLALAQKCIASGFSSVMFDGSAMSFEDNIKFTKEVTDYALPMDVSVEGELGTIGGKEEGDTDLEATYTKVSEAEEFVRRTNVSTLAIGVGTAHGVYKGEPKINVQRIKEIHEAIETPLVLHGASGLSDEVIRDCIAAGISKINFATELRQAYTNGIKAEFEKDPEVFDPKIYMRGAIDSIKDVIRAKIKICYGIKAE
ncbi:MAG: class II fructose-bisphosphate aldolase [Clostridia bacterium]|nr:class II fructose-bisphosphate aldolase [Clostridia bacterium]MBQ3129023.1 class II fructose-bisphosphate aldolase [Clostridia bacterium]